MEQGQTFLAKGWRNNTSCYNNNLALSFFPNFGQDINSSYAAGIGKVFEPLTKHLGWDWRINTGLVFGIAAKKWLFLLIRLYLMLVKDP